MHVSTMVTTARQNDDYSLYVNSLSGSLVAGAGSAESHDAKAADGLDSILAEELYAMSVRDRDTTQEEIHGVRSVAREESPEMIGEAFRCFQNEIEKIPTKKAYDEAVSSNSYYVLHDRGFRIRFLRADSFDAKKAAIRFINHLDLLMDYFGPDALQRPLRHSDLSKEVQDVVRSGSIQLLPNRDRAGRLVIFYHRGDFDLADGDKPLESSMGSRLRTLLYLLSAISEDVDTQRHGLVFMFSTNFAMANDHQSKGDVDKVKDLMQKFFKGWPVRSCSHHISFPDIPILNVLRAWIMFVAFNKEERARVKFYKGVWSTETRYQLMGYGIPSDEIPMTPTGAMKIKNHIQWIKTRKAIDMVRKSQETSFINAITDRHAPTFTPTTHARIPDVLFRQGGNKYWQGNMHFKDLIESKADLYNATSSRKVRRQIRQDIVNGIVQAPRCGRFLELNASGWWDEITDADAIDSKVTVALHERNRNLTATRNRQDSKSDTMKFSALDGIKRRRLDGGNDEECFCGCNVL